MEPTGGLCELKKKPSAAAPYLGQQIQIPLPTGLWFHFMDIVAPPPRKHFQASFRRHAFTSIFFFLALIKKKKTVIATAVHKGRPCSSFAHPKRSFDTQSLFGRCWPQGLQSLLSSANGQLNMALACPRTSHSNMQPRSLGRGWGESGGGGRRPCWNAVR